MKTESSFLNGKSATRGTKGSARPDVYDEKAGDVYDYKFTTNPGEVISKAQQDHNLKNLPKVVDQIEINP